MCHTCILVDMLQCLKHDHSWLGDSVLTECKIPIGTSSNSLHGPSTKALNTKIVRNAFTMDVSKQFVNCLKKNIEEINEQLSHLHAAISVDINLSQLTIIPSSCIEDLKDWKMNCQSVIRLYLASLLVATFSFPSEIKDTMVPVICNIIQNHPLLHIKYDAESSIVVVIGERGRVDKVKKKLEDAYDSQMIKKESMLIQEQRFWSFLCVKLHKLLANHPRIEAILDSNKNCICIMGTKYSRIAFKAELESLRTSMASV